MTGRPLRRPARVWRIAGHYLRALAGEPLLLPIALVLLAMATTVDGPPQPNGPIYRAPFEEMTPVLGLYFFLPLLQWRRMGGRADFDAAAPLGKVRHALLRTACGTAWALLLLGGAVWILAWNVGRAFPRDGTLGGLPMWFPYGVVATGMIFYLFGAAVMEGSERPGRVLLAWYVVGRTALALPLGAPARALTLPFAEFDDARAASFTEWFPWIAAWLALAALCVALAAAGTHRRLTKLIRSPWPRMKLPLPGDAALPADTPRRPVGAGAVFRREWARLRGRMVPPVIISAALTVMTLFPSPEAEGEGHLGFLAVVAFLWPLLVWRDERGAAREVEEAIPAGITTRRLMRIAAGGAWLLVCTLVLTGGAALAAVAEGGKMGYAVALAFLGIPCAVLLSYLLGAIMLRPTEDAPFWAALLLGVFTLTALSVSGRLGSFAPGAVLAPLGFWVSRSLAWWNAAVIWIPFFTAGLVAAVWADVQYERRRGAPRPPRPGLLARIASLPAGPRDSSAARGR